MHARIVALLILLLGVPGCAAQGESPRAHDGVLDLSAWDFTAQGPVALRGEWEFAWLESYDPAAPRWDGEALARDYLTLPGLWQGKTQAGVPLSPYGYGVYRLQIRLDQALVSAPERLALLLSAPLSVCRVWVDGLLVGETGTPGEDAGSERPVAHMVTPWFVPKGDVMEVVLQVSNHHNLQGGLNKRILLGTETQITRMVLTRWILGALICGSLLALCVYHLTLSLSHRRERANLYFALFCLMWAAAIAFSPHYAFLLPHFITLPWSWGVTLALLPFGLTIPLMLVFYHELFPKRYGQWINIGYSLLGAAYMAYILATPPNAYDTVPFLYFLITRTAFVYLIGAFILDVVNRNQGVLLLIPGYLALGAAEFADRILDVSFAGATPMAPLGVVVFICCYSLFMSSRYSLVSDKAERLAVKLQIADDRILQLHARKESQDHVRQEAMPDSPAPPDKRILAVRVMNLAVDCWMACTGSSKARLARQSGLWSVYVEKDGYCRTQTLDKYTSANTLPLRPQWRKIHATAKFVLAECADDTPVRAELERCLGELKGLA